MNTNTIHPACLRVLGAVLTLPRPVTVRDVAQATTGRRRFTNGVIGHLERLREAGLVTWDRGRKGTIRPTCRVDCQTSGQDI